MVGGEALEQHDRSGDRARGHFLMAMRERVDQRIVAGMLALQFRAGLGERAAGIVLQMPRHGADLGEEALHRGIVTVEQLAIEMARVPVEQDSAEIEDHGFRHGHVTALRSRAT